MVRKLELSLNINGEMHVRYTTDIEEAILFLYKNRGKMNTRACVSYKIDNDSERFFTIDRFGHIQCDSDNEDEPPTKPGDPGWDPELTEWFYEDD